MSFTDSEEEALFGAFSDEPSSEDSTAEAAGPLVESHSTVSSAITNLTYHHDTGELFITFTDGRRYVIPEFPEIELERWLKAASIGGYFNAFVRGNY